MKKGSAGWLILVAALAVPGFLFYNWWSNQSAANRAELEKRVRNRLPPGTPMFNSQPAQEKLDNPLGQAEASAAAPAAQASTSSVQAAALPVTASSAPVVVEPAPAAVPVPVPVPADAPAGSVGVAESTETFVALARAPTLSPYDMVRIEQASLERELRRRELAEGVQVTRKREVRKIERPVENDIDLQGIVSTDEGQKAIINGEMVAEGELVRGAKIVKITSTAVVFMHRGRRFSKTISQ
jgi:hypothetical protein